MITNIVKPTDTLPLTCSRKGSCCHGNQVFLNPWELTQLAKEKDTTPRNIIDQFCENGGIQLKFKGKIDNRGNSACNLYTEDFGCSAHKGRPLPCRLFPLGRQIQNDEAQYIFQGKDFPCITNDCPEVLELPKLTVEEYLKGQETELFEIAQDEYLEVMQNLADIAFALLLDTELAQSGDKTILQLWRVMRNELPQDLLKRIPSDWIDALILPEIDSNADTPSKFIQIHNELLQTKAQQEFESIQTLEDIKDKCVQMMAITLFLAKGIGANPKALVELWVEVAKENGAIE